MGSLECNIIEKSWYENNIILEINKSRVATIWLNRQEKHNALNNDMLLALNKAFDFLEDYHSENNSNIKLLLLKSKGKTFCAGADLKSMQRMVDFSYEENYQDAITLARVLERLSDFACPTIAVVQGDAYGGGVGLICAADFAIALDKAQFSLTEVKLGLIPAVICPYLVATMSYKHALRSMLTAEKFSAKKAGEFNMLSHIVKNDSELTKEVDKLVHGLLLNGPLAMQKAKSLAKEVYQNQDPNILSKTAEYIANIRISTEGQEGLQAFLEKRKPNWIIE